MIGFHSLCFTRLIDYGLLGWSEFDDSEVEVEDCEGCHPFGF